MLEYLYVHDYKSSTTYDVPDIDEEPAPANEGESTEGKACKRTLTKDKTGKLNLCWLHSEMYIHGDRYQIAGLKSCSLSKFQYACEIDIPQALEMETISSVYDGTLDSDRSMRDVLVNVICQNIAKLTDPARQLHEALQDSHAFAIDVALALTKKDHPRASISP